MQSYASSRHRIPDTRLAPCVWGLAAVFVLVQLVILAVGPYGYFNDEFYYLACARRLDWGYVDHPPLSIAVLAAIRAVLGESLLAIRLPAALALGAVAVVAAEVARRLGGGRFAQALAALAVLVSPIAFVMGSFFSMNAFEVLLWPLCGLVLLRLLESDEPRWWLAVGLLLGLALMNKHTSALLGVGLAIGLLMTPARRHLRTPWPWCGAGLAFLVLMPNLIWQQANGWPSLEFYRISQLHKNIPTPPLAVVAAQIQFVGPGALPLWLAGLGSLLWGRGAKPFRLLGWAFVSLFGLMLVGGMSRPDRIGAYYPILFGAGAVVLESASAVRRWVRPVLVALLLASGLFVAPLTLPLLAPERVAAYAHAVGLQTRIERDNTSPIPQWLADRTGWPEFIADMEAVYRSLSAEDQARAVFYAPSFGQAGALELFGPSRGLPSVICNHNNYYFWTAESADPQVLIAAGAKPEDLREWFRKVEFARVHRCAYCMSWRNEVPIWIAREPITSLRKVWPQLKRFL